MDAVFGALPLVTLVLAFVIAFGAGAIKGMVGFGLPTIMISALSSIFPPQTALAMLILPTLVTNANQALRQGWGPAWASIKRFRVFLIVGGVALVATAQLVTVLPDRVLFLVIGIPVAGFALLQLAGWTPRIAQEARARAEWIAALIAGGLGGVSGIWGPPTVAYLTALDTRKVDQMRVQGLVYGLGSALLAVAHVQSGVLNPTTAPLSAVLIVPALIGLWLGFKVQDRMDQVAFRKATLVVLTLAGLNLIRRGVFG